MTLRVLHVTPSVAKTDGGPAEVVRGLVPALISLGIEVDVFSTSKGWSDLDSDLATISWLRLYRHYGPGSLTYSPGLAAAVRSEVSKYDLVHVHGLQSHVGTAAMRAARRAGVPYVVEPHGALDAYHWSENFLRKRAYLQVFDRSNWRRASGWVVSSAFEAEQGAHALPDARFFAWPLGVDEDLFSLHGSRDSQTPHIALYLGRLTRKKRLDLILKAMTMEKVRKSGLRLIVAGSADGTLLVDPQSFIEEHDLEATVSLLGPVDREARRRLLQLASIFVLPSEDESFGVAVAEAMAAGLAVVSTDRVGVAIEAGDAVSRVSIDAGELAAELARLANDLQATRSLADLGQQYASAHFTWASAAERARSAYCQVLERSDD